MSALKRALAAELILDQNSKGLLFTKNSNNRKEVCGFVAEKTGRQNGMAGDKFLSPGDKLKSPETRSQSGQGTKFPICPLLALLLSIKKKIYKGDYSCA